MDGDSATNARSPRARRILHGDDGDDDGAPTTPDDDVDGDVSAMLDELRAINQHLRSLATTGGVGAGDASTAPDEVAYQFEFSTWVPADTPTHDPVVTERTIPHDGRLEILFIGWPAGAQQDVGVGFGEKEGEDLFPRNEEDDYVAMDDFFHPFDMGKPVSEDDELVARLANRDTQNGHYVNVLATVVFPESEVNDGA